MRVEDIMTPNPHCVAPTDSVVRAALLMRDHDVGMIPVVDTDRRPSGVLTDRDIAIRHVAVAHRGDCPCEAAMTRGELACVRPDDDVSDVLRSMKASSVRRVLVTDDAGRLVGVVAEADLLRHANEIGEHAVVESLEAISEPTVVH